MTAAVLIMAGGTGGHVFPALAVARLLRERQCRVVWVGTQRGIEARVVPADKFPIEWLSVAGLRGKGALTWVLAPFKLMRALFQAMSIVRKVKPDVVLGVGGFVTGPGGVAAWLLGKPLIIHEQNAISGLTNRLLSRFARNVLEAFPGSFPARVHAQCVGNPVRREIAAVLAPEQRFAGRTGPIRLLVVGGSLGAARLNASVPAAARLLQAELPLDIWHQAGERGHEQAVAAYAQAGVQGRIAPFINDMAEAYAWADLVVCRAGALTISELAAAGVGAILVPFPAAVDDHQAHNARYLTENGAAMLVADRELTAERLAGAIRELCGSAGDARTNLLQMAKRARERAVVDAAEVLTRTVLDAAGGAA